MHPGPDSALFDPEIPSISADLGRARARERAESVNVAEGKRSNESERVDRAISVAACAVRYHRTSHAQPFWRRPKTPKRTDQTTIQRFFRVRSSTRAMPFPHTMRTRPQLSLSDRELGSLGRRHRLVLRSTSSLARIQMSRTRHILKRAESCLPLSSSIILSAKAGKRAPRPDGPQQGRDGTGMVWRQALNIAFEGRDSIAISRVWIDFDCEGQRRWQRERERKERLVVAGSAEYW